MSAVIILVVSVNVGFNRDTISCIIITGWLRMYRCMGVAVIVACVLYDSSYCTVYIHVHVHVYVLYGGTVVSWQTCIHVRTPVGDWRSAWRGETLHCLNSVTGCWLLVGLST